MANVLPRHRQLEVVHLLAEGNSIRSIQRLTGTDKKTVLRLLVSFGQRCRNLLDREMRGLTLDHLEIDECWTFCQKKQARLTLEERLVHPLEHREHQPLLGTEVVVDQALVDAGLGGNGARGERRVATGDDAAPGRLHDGLAHRNGTGVGQSPRAWA